MREDSFAVQLARTVPPNPVDALSSSKASQDIAANSVSHISLGINPIGDMTRQPVKGSIGSLVRDQ